MKADGRGGRALLLLAMCAAILAPIADSRSAPQNTTSDDIAPPLIRQMVGTWNVEQRMWPAPSANAINLPPAVARRRLVEGAFLEEIMSLAPGSKGDRFTRIAYFNYNAVDQKYEYFSLDTRVPQMMNEKSREAVRQSETPDQRFVLLDGGRFVAPRWGDATNAAFTYRLAVGKVENGRQVVQLYLTPQSTESTKEFLAFEYVYTRKR
jgi:hypothetical protein